MPGTAGCGGLAFDPPAVPPFAGTVQESTGCAAPHDDATRLDVCEARVARAVGAFFTKAAACQVREARAVFKNGGASATTLADARACESDGKRSAVARLATVRRRPCPVEMTGRIALLRSTLLTGPLSLDAMNHLVHCGEGLAVESGGGVDAGMVPSPSVFGAKRALKCQAAAWKNAARYARRLLACQSKVGSFLAGRRRKPIDLTTCEAAATAAHARVAEKRTGKRGCPACLDMEAADSIHAAVLARVRHLIGYVYACDAGGNPLVPLADLGANCLYMPVGVAPIPDGTEKVIEIAAEDDDVLTLAGSDGTGPADCTRGAGPGWHCLTEGGAVCSVDADCGGAPGACAPDAQCFFVPPIPLSNGPLSVCVVDVILSDQEGTVNVVTGKGTLIEHHASRIYLTADPLTPCPRCVEDVCTSGMSVGASCTAIGSLATAVECLPKPAQFIALLELLEHYTTGLAFRGDFGEGFCSGQTQPGAFGVPAARGILAQGIPAGDLRDGASHEIRLASVFCIADTGNPLIDALVGLPTPGAVTAVGTLQLE